MTSPSQRRALLSMFSAQPHHLAEIWRYAYFVEYGGPDAVGFTRELLRWSS